MFKKSQIQYCIDRNSYLLEYVEENRVTFNMWSDWNWCWFQTSLPLAALPLRRMIIACCFRVTALSGHAALALSQSGIAPELNRIQLSAVCCCGQSSGVIDLLARRCLPLGLPSASLWQVVLAQLYNDHHQSGNAASGKLVWKQH